MQLIEVQTKSEIRAFLQVHRSLYKNDPHFISHLDQDVEKVFDPKQNKFFRFGEAIRWILKDDGGKVIGRVAAFVNKKGNTEHKSGMGFFECVDNREAAFMLFDACRDWLKARDMEEMDGPINFGEKERFWGLIIENFEAAPYYGQNYNPEYYVRLFEEYGFQIYYKQLIYRRMVAEPMPQKYFERSDRIKRNPDYRIQHIEKKHYDKYIEDFRLIYNAAWGRREGDGFVGMSKAQAKGLFNTIKIITDEDLSHFAYHKDKPIAFYISLPEINQIFKRVNGNLNWWGKLIFLWHLKVRKSFKTSFGVAFGVHPDYQGKGIEGALINNLRDHIQDDLKYDDIIVTWIGDFNPKMIAIIDQLGCVIYRTMATYRYNFDREKPFKRKKVVGVKVSDNQ